jgi:hypothetical protein
VNHEIYDAVKGKLTGAHSPQDIYVVTAFSNSSAAVFHTAEREVRQDGLIDYSSSSDMYLYFYGTKTFIKSPFQHFGMGSHLSADGTKTLAFTYKDGYDFLGAHSDGDVI